MTLLCTGSRPPITQVASLMIHSGLDEQGLEGSLGIGFVDGSF